MNILIIVYNLPLKFNLVIYPRGAEKLIAI